ncbi:MAG: family 1 glycosylhydrolase [Breznakibacter sp.]
MLKKSDFGKDFRWGTTISAFQNEGAATMADKSPSIWDHFVAQPDIVKNRDKIGDAADFYHRYKADLKLASHLNFNAFRFAPAWTRILPNGTGPVNHKGVDFYDRVIDKCLKRGLEPWLTLYHWDLPQILEDKGGWTNRDVVDWYSEFAHACTTRFGDRVKHWIVMNEPMTFTGMGYFMGYHAPGRKGITNFLPAAHHAVLCMTEGGRIVKQNVRDGVCGPALSCSYVSPVNLRPRNLRAAQRVEALLNRFFLEPLLGMGYPTDVMPALTVMEHYMKPGDKEKMRFDFDFIGLQYYFRVVAKFSLTPPILFANEVSPSLRKAKLNLMNLDVYPKGLKHLLKFYADYPQIKQLILTESGVCFPDFPIGGRIHDVERTKYHQEILKVTKKAIKKGVPVGGYFAWTLVDNFEWREGFEPRFGLVYNDFSSQQRIVKDSGEWFKEFLNEKK